MPIKITLLYTALLAILTIALMINVVRLRNSQKVNLGDGGNKVLTQAIRAHGNLTENAPIALLVILLLEMIGSANWIVHTLGAVLVVGRLLHAHALLTAGMPGRVVGAVATNLVVLVGAALLLRAYAGL